MNDLDSKLQETHILVNQAKSILEKIKPLEERIKKAEELAGKEKKPAFLNAKKRYEGQMGKIIKPELFPLREKIRDCKDSLETEISNLDNEYRTKNAMIQIEEELKGSPEELESLKTEVSSIARDIGQIKKILSEIKFLEDKMPLYKPEQTIDKGREGKGRDGESWSGRYE